MVKSEQLVCCPIRELQRTLTMRLAGLRQGDIILMINNVDVKDVSQFRQLVKDLPEGKSVPMLVQRGAGPMFLALKMPDKDN